METNSITHARQLPTTNYQRYLYADIMPAPPPSRHVCLMMSLALVASLAAASPAMPLPSARVAVLEAGVDKMKVRIHKKLESAYAAWCFLTGDGVSRDPRVQSAPGFQESEGSISCDWVFY